jgi:hypothetical protein
MSYSSSSIGSLVEESPSSGPALGMSADRAVAVYEGRRARNRRSGSAAKPPACLARA